MGMTFEQVDKLASSLLGVTTGLRWGKRTWLINEHGFAWERPLGKADLARLVETPPTGDILGIVCEDLDAKDALLAFGLPGFFTIQHFNNYPAVLVELRKARVKDVRAAILDAFRTQSARPLKKSAKSKRPAKPRGTIKRTKQR